MESWSAGVLEHVCEHTLTETPYEGPQNELLRAFVWSGNAACGCTYE